jgi:translation initiation factor 3 subunit D
MLSALAKLQIDARQVVMEDLLWCGMLHQYNKIHDRVTPKMEKALQRFEELNFFNVSTTDDPLLPQYLQEDPTISVIATDHVLASLIAAARSIYSWDIVITKIGGKLILDKRDGSHIDFLTVDETAHEPPNNDDANHINAPVKLGQEASCLNQNFSQMVLDYNIEPEDMANPHPFEDEDEPDGCAASGAYRYRKITLPGNPKEESEFNRNPVSIAVRTEVNCKMGEDHYVSVKAVNEYDQKKGQSWRKCLDSQRGAVLATVLKDNAFKLGRWTAQAILSGCDTLKLGYISRKEDSDPWAHHCLTVTTYQVDGFAEQIGMANNNIFGILRSIIDLVMGQDDGKFVLLKDPTKSVMRLFTVPWDTFGEEEGEGDEEEEEEEEEDGKEE